MANEALSDFHPIVRDWFAETLGQPSAPQVAGWPAIASGADTLILAPTGTGKTLAAFLWELNALITEGLEAPLANAVHLLYVSPLKALNNDVQRNLELPLAQLKDRFEKAGDRGQGTGDRSVTPSEVEGSAPLRSLRFPDIRVAVRTGDTTSSARAKMLRKTPHILITTPESLHILLTSVRGRTIFSSLRAVIIDEIHAVAGTKRGAHLALTLERLARVAPAAPQRIGLSATQKPLDEVARFLGGAEAGAGPSLHSGKNAEGAEGQRAQRTAGKSGPSLQNDHVRFRPVTIVDCGLVKRMEMTVQSPVPDLAHVDGTIWTAVAPLVLERIRGARTTLIFVNNRAQSEKIAARVNALAEEEIAQPYHGSLSRERRFMLEERLKAGELRALVTTSSLELGIDVGSVDLVVLLQSPKRVSAALQRVGRAGHSLLQVSRGVFVPTFRDDALEQWAILDAMRSGDVEPTRVVQNALDVLAQIIVAIVASEPDWTATELFNFVRNAYPYHALTRAAFDETLAMLAGKYPSDVAAELEARVSWDRISDVLTPSRASRMVATISGGTIPDRGLYAVNLADKTRLGELDEEFVHESRVGDAFQLGSSTWRIRAIEHDRVIVIPAPGAAARMPFWHGEFMARSIHLTPRVGAIRRLLDEARTVDDLHDIQTRFSSDESTTRSLVEYVQSQRSLTEIVPDEKHLVLEHFRDDVGSVRMVLHAPFGGRVNAPWGMALGRRIRDRLGIECQVQTTDDGLMLRLPDLGAAPPLDAIRALSAEEGERLVLEEVGGSSLFGARFRMNAARALLLPRGNPKRRMPLWLQRLKAADLLQAVNEYPSFPIVVETYRDVLQDAFDMAGLRDVLAQIASGAITIRTVETQIPSPFAQSLQFGFVMDHLYDDDTPRAEQRAALLSLDRALLDELMGAEGADDQTLAMLETVLARRRGTAKGRQARDADELAVLVDRAGDLTRAELEARVAPSSSWFRENPLTSLLASGRLLGVLLPTAGPSLRSGENAEGAEVQRAQRTAVGTAGAGPSLHSGRQNEQRADSARRQNERAVTPSEVEGSAPPATPWLEERFILVDAYARYAAAFGAAALDVVRVGEGLVPRPAIDVVPAPLREVVLTEKAARREVLGRWLSLAGPVSVEGVRVRYDFDASWVERRMEDWERKNVLVRGVFGGDRSATRWTTRRLLEQARRRELAQARKQIEAVPLDTFARYLQRWQHLTPESHHTGSDATAHALSQMYGLARPAEGWERDYLPARVEQYDPSTLARLAANGTLVWAAEPSAGNAAPSMAKVGRIRFFERGTGRLWLAAPANGDALSENARRVRDALKEQGASFTADLSAATGLGPQATKDALHELVAEGLVTNDTVDALRDVLRWKSVLPVKRGNEPDPARWLPADFKPSENRPVVQRRVNLRRLPKWRRPELADAGTGAWGGRWVLVHTSGTMGPARGEQELAEQIARKWLDRYGIVSRDWWKRERPAVGWTEIYHQLKRMEFRGDVQRGYFVSGLAGAQFALPEAVELLRATGPDAEEATVVFPVSDPANVYSLPLAPGMEGDPLSRPRGVGALLVTRAGKVVLAVESKGARIRVNPGASFDEVREAAQALGGKLIAPVGRARRRDVVVETIDGERAAGSRWTEAFVEAGFRSMGMGLRYFAGA